MKKYICPVIALTNFGPISKAKIELKPLNIFIGGHNTGKSYTAQLIYCIAKSLNEDYEAIRSLDESVNLEGHKASEELKELEKKLRGRKKFGFESIGGELHKSAKIMWSKSAEITKLRIQDGLRHYFNVDELKDLIRFGDDSDGCFIGLTIKNEERPIKVEVRIRKRSKAVSVKINPPNIEKAELNKSNVVFFGDMDGSDFARVVFEEWRRPWTEIAVNDSYYLPAARSGILQVLPMLQLMVLERATEKMGLPLLVKDFLLAIRSSMSPWRRKKTGKIPALELLESEILHGGISHKGSRRGEEVIDYNFGKGNIPIQRASSMVAELAPLDLLIKNNLASGDLLIIEEPEAHLHPSSQMQVARVLVRLVNSGVRVICTTHSHLLLNRISNLMLASKSSKSIRDNIGLKDVDLLSEDDLGVYQFNYSETGSKVKHLRVTSKFGIPEEEFLEEYEKISAESYKVSS